MAGIMNKTGKLSLSILRRASSNFPRSLTEPVHRDIPSISSHIYLAGIQPTGIPHLGNYFGFIEQWTDLQEELPKETQMFLSVADQHAISLGPIVPASILRQNTHKMTASLIACGVDPERTVLFRQSDVPEIAQLSWILGSLQTTSKLSRLPQYKEKMKRFEKKGNIPVGLLTYPLLQAADVLTFKASHVPVGEDQSQHMNLLSGLAYAFCKTYNTDVFPIPQQVTKNTHARIRSLRDPEKKMSKSSGGEKSRIDITDSREEIFEKCLKAKSDNEGMVTYDENRLAVLNLIDLYSAVTRKPIEKLDFITNWSTLELKTQLAEEIDKRFGPIRERCEKLKDSKEVDEILFENGKKARQVAERNLEEVRRIVGFL